MLGNDVVLIIVGNKLDMDRNRIVQKQKAEEFAKSVGAKHFETSAKLNQGVKEMFSELTKFIVEKEKESEGDDAHKKKQKGVFVISEQPQDTKKDEGCCAGSSST